MSYPITSLNEEIMNSIQESKERLRIIYEAVRGKEGIDDFLLQSIEKYLEP